MVVRRKVLVTCGNDEEVALEGVILRQLADMNIGGLQQADWIPRY